MFSLLNPALTPIKAKIALIAAGIVLALLLAALATSGVLFRMYKAAQTEIGSLGAQLDQTEQLVRDNEAVRQRERLNYELKITNQNSEKEALASAVAAAQAREQRYDRQLAAALRTLKESTDANEEAREWAVVPVPAAVIHGMCAAAKEAVGEAATCRDHEDGIDHDPGLPARAVPGGAAT